MSRPAVEIRVWSKLRLDDTCIGFTFSEFWSVERSNVSTPQMYRPLAVGMSVGMAKCVAVILEYSAWAFFMGHKCRECVYSSFAVNQNKWST